MAQYARGLDFFQGLAMRPTTTAGLVLAACSAAPAATAQSTPLKSPRDFAAIADTADRSRALFVEAGKVIQGPRCQNCQPVGERPSPGDDMHPNLPPAVRGVDDHGAIAMRGATCHQVANFAPAGVPGAPNWHMVHDEIVGWGWHQGGSRAPAPGTQAQFGALVDAWIRTGAACPAS
jgi:hypothetical protein